VRAAKLDPRQAGDDSWPPSSPASARCVVGAARGVTICTRHGRRLFRADYRLSGAVHEGRRVLEVNGQIGPLARSTAWVTLESNSRPIRRNSTRARRRRSSALAGSLSYDRCHNHTIYDVS